MLAVLKVLLLPLVLFFKARLVAYDTVSQTLAFAPGRLGVGIRRAWYGMTLAACGERLVVDFMGAIRTPLTKVGNNCYIGRANWVGLADIGDDFLAGNAVTIHSGAHQHGFARTDVPMRLQPGRHERIRIGKDVWLGSHVVINADVADGTIVASGSVVSKTFPPYAVLGGVPAKVIRSREPSET
jgi:acetyltransferase-like isoleucine patch superfamily enzyme